MPLGGRVTILGIAALLAACLLASCGNGPTTAQKKAVHDILTTTTTTTVPATTSTSPTAATQPGVAVPNVIGLKIVAARSALRAAGFPSVSLNTPCNKGTLASQSVAASLATPGKAPDVQIGANDVLFIPSSTGLKAASIKVAEMAASLAGYAAIYHW